MRAPSDLLPDLLHPSQRGRGSERRRQALKRKRQGAGSKPAHAASASPRMAPGEIRKRVTAAIARAGHVGEIGSRDHTLPGALQLRGEQFAAGDIELAHHVIQQHQRHMRALACKYEALGQQQRKQSQSLLSLRAK